MIKYIFLCQISENDVETKGASADLVLNIHEVEEASKLCVCVYNDPFREKKNYLCKFWSGSFLLCFSIITRVSNYLKQ